MSVLKVMTLVKSYRRLTQGGDIPVDTLRKAADLSDIAEATKQGLILCIGIRRDIRYRLTGKGLDYSVYRAVAGKRNG